MESSYFTATIIRQSCIFWTHFLAQPFNAESLALVSMDFQEPLCWDPGNTTLRRTFSPDSQYLLQLLAFQGVSVGETLSVGILYPSQWSFCTALKTGSRLHPPVWEILKYSLPCYWWGCSNFSKTAVSCAIALPQAKHSLSFPDSSYMHQDPVSWALYRKYSVHTSRPPFFNG